MIATVTLAACSSGSLGSGSGDCTDDGCRDSGPGPVDPGDSGRADPCDSLVCPPGQLCRDGRCSTVDPCEGVTCPAADQTCDPRDGTCRSSDVDGDGDGYTLGGGDCDDGDPTVFPEAEEICDGADQDCDTAVDEGHPDLDGDGFDTCGFGDPSQADCDDANALRNPGLAEDCDGLDNDCDDAVDENLDVRVCTTACGDGEARCEGGAWICSAPDTCECPAPGDREEEDCGSCGHRERTCGADLRWSDWSACAGEGECVAGTDQAQPCGQCGTQQRTCSADCHFSDWSGCAGEGECAPFETETQACEQCGQRVRSCSETCSFGPWGDCTNAGECIPGSFAPCTTSCGSSGERACTSACAYGDCTPPAESCNGVDDDCDGQCDEDGCRQGIHRSSHPGGDHLYTPDATEAGCCGYTVESSNYFFLATSPIPGTTAFWRCWNPSIGEHFYTTHGACEDAPTMSVEHSIGYIATSAICGAVPLYRLWLSTGFHFYTTSEYERDVCVSNGWIYEHVAGYVWTTG